MSDLKNEANKTYTKRLLWDANEIRCVRCLALSSVNVSPFSPSSSPSSLITHICSYLGFRSILHPECTVGLLAPVAQG